MKINTTLRSMLEFQELMLGPVDYSLFGGLIALSLVIGLYFGFFSKQNSTNEYLFGGKTMGYIPVATSMLAGHVSGITLLGVPTEVYQHGSTYFLIVLTVILTCLVVTYVFLPVFYKLQLPSTYEYLEIRFCRRIRTLASMLYVLSLIMYIPLVVYVPALAFSQVTGYSLYVITPVLCTICIAYTSLGGVKAVIWTDTIQFVFTMGGLLAVFFIGIHAVGGFSEAWDIASQGNRTEIFNMDPSPYVRKSFWGMSISLTVMFLAHFGVSQNCVQRFLSISKERDVRKALLLLAIGMIVMKCICALTGLTMFAWYHDCDPLRAKIVKRSDQILPYYVMDIAGDLSGLPGVFLAGLVSCALSTMSAALNTLAGTIYDDFIDQWLPESSNKEVRATTIMKIISVIIGLIGMAMAFLVQHLGTIFEISISIRSVVEGPLLGLFVLGMMFPWVGRKGALTGACISLAVMHWIVIGNQWNVYKKRVKHSPLPTSITGCPYPLNETGLFATTTTTTLMGNYSTTPVYIASESEMLEEEPVFFMFRVSMLHFNLIGTLVTIIAGVITSFAIGEGDASKVNPDHITPIMQRFLPGKKYVEVPLKEISGNKANGKEIYSKDSENGISKKAEILR